jgi:hypothetical protein
LDGVNADGIGIGGLTVQESRSPSRRKMFSGGALQRSGGRRWWRRAGIMAEILLASAPDPYSGQWLSLCDQQTAESVALHCPE